MNYPVRAGLKAEDMAAIIAVSMIVMALPALRRRGGQERSGYAAASVLSPAARAIGVAAILGVSSAFLDADMKQDPIAQEWLNKDAKRWLEESGEMRKK